MFPGGFYKLTLAMAAVAALANPLARASESDPTSLYERHRAEYERRDTLEEQLMGLRHERSEIVSRIQDNAVRLRRIESGEEAIGSAVLRNQTLSDLNRQSRELQARLPGIIGSEVGLKRELDRPEMKVIIPCPHNPLWDLLDTECAAVTAKIGISGSPDAAAQAAAPVSADLDSREPAAEPQGPASAPRQAPRGLTRVGIGQ